MDGIGNSRAGYPLNQKMLEPDDAVQPVEYDPELGTIMVPYVFVFDY
jgi:hypothetical protein